MSLQARTRYFIAEDERSVACIGCGQIYGPHDPLGHRRPGCLREAPHFRYATHWIRAYQAGEPWRSMLPPGYRRSFDEQRDVVIGIELPPAR